ncbi:carbohydrate ABC transporter permease [Salinarchaeum laminariae]|uniref:carbohydrate ABC transporter permease n=1 Tax=Salinarchaeum laminariae TaxID=869888 RepID=UPI0020BEBAFC|nr:carbohydrate ABC transporter permease [Salinarchaeum laminariae]
MTVRENVANGFRIVLDGHRRSSLLSRIGFYVATALTLLFSLYPFYVMFITSISTNESLYSRDRGVIPKSFTLEHYEVIFGSGSFPVQTYFWNSLSVALVTSVIALVVSILGAYSFTRLDYPGGTLIRRGIIVVYMLAAITLVIPLFQLLVRFDLVDTKTSLYITYTVKTLPLTLYILWNYFRSIPVEIEEAAFIDGYSRLETIARVIVPVSLPVLVAAFLFSFKIAWNEYLFASVFLQSEALYTLPIGIETLDSAFQNVWGEIMAASIITTLPIIVMFLYLEKYMVEGLTAGAVEG